MKTILTIKRISLSLVLLVVIISLASGNTLGNIAVDMQKTVSGSSNLSTSPVVERLSSPFFSDPLSREDERVFDTEMTIKGSERADSVSNQWKSSLSMLKQEHEPLVADEPILEFDLGDYFQLTFTHPEIDLWMRFTYTDYIDPTHVNVTLESPDSPAWISVNTQTRLVEDGVWTDIYYPYHIETDIDVGDTINWFDVTGYVDGTIWYDWDGTLLEAWVILLDDYFPGTYIYFHKGTGILLYYWDSRVDEEVFITDTNMITFEPILEFDLGDYFQLNLTIDTPPWMRFTYTDYIDPTHVNVTMEAPGSPGWISVNTLTRLVEDGEFAFYYPYQIETDIDVGDTINWFMGTGYVDGTTWYDWDGTLLEAWILLLDDYYPGTYAYFHKGTGIMLYIWDSQAEMEAFITDTNMINFAPTVTVTYPNGGEKLSGSATLTWTATDSGDDPLTFAVYYWDGSSWLELASDLDEPTYAWDTTTVPDGSAYETRVVASDGELTGEDTSDGTFTIDNPDPPTVTLTSPNGGETLSGSVTLTWTATDPDGDTLTFTVYYWDGSSWVELASGLDEPTYAWNTAKVPDGSTYKIRVVASDGTLTGEDASDAAFTIDNPDPPTVTLIYPNSDEILSGIVTINWTATDLDGDALTFTVSYWDGNDWVDLESDLTTTSYDWDTRTVPNGSGYKVRVVASDGTLTGEDESDNTFTIMNPGVPGFEAILAILILLSLGLTAILRKRFRAKK